MEDRIVVQAPDSLSAVRFSPDGQSLLSSCWDGSVGLFSASGEGSPLLTYSHSGAALCCAFVGNDQAVSGSLDQTVRVCDVATGAARVLGAHDDGVSHVATSSTTGLVVSGGWDAVVNLWDVRSGSSAGALPVSGKVYGMDVSGDRLAVGTSDHQIALFDLRNLAAPPVVRESQIKHQTRVVRFNAQGDVFVVGTVEGRVAVEFSDPSETAQAGKYCFKCHRTADTVYPINAVAFHPVHGTFATGGADATVSVWDGQHKKRCVQFAPCASSIADLDFSPDGNSLAIAVSYTFERGDQPHPQDHILLRPMSLEQVQPRQQ